MNAIPIVSFIIAIIGCLVGLAGWLSKRDNKTEKEAEWRGSINAKLNMILGIKEDVEEINKNIADHEARIRNLEGYHIHKTEK